MRWIIVIRSGLLIALLLAAGATSSGGCGPLQCPEGMLLYTCEAIMFTNSACGCGSGQKTVFDSECGLSTTDAETRASGYFRSKYPGWRVFTVNCTSTGQAQTLSVEPSLMAQGPPSCSPSTDDNACVLCMKASCCGQLEACLNDSNCVCWVGCKYAGNTDAECSQTAYCGALDDVSSAAAVCLDTQCPEECGTMETTSCGCGGSGSGGGSGSSGGPSCTPGSFGPGDTCFSDGDCASCMCNLQTMTCN
jgi:hypothetical protein